MMLLSFKCTNVPINRYRMTSYVIGIDIGTTSVRGALVTRTGELQKIATKKINTWNPRPQFYQQSSDEIWSACCTVVKELIIGISPDDVKGLGFDATCSMVVLDTEGNPLSVNVDNDDQNIILWMDHRAQNETEFINQTKHPILNNAGGRVSVESMIPKILWIKNNRLECWNKSGYFFLLPDFLTWRATGEDKRSLCCVIGKCNYECSPKTSQWNKNFFDAIGLKELSEQNWKKIGNTVIKPGEICGKLTATAALETGLMAGIPVGASLIDAHAGGIGVMGCYDDNIPSHISSRLAMICGTSTCHMVQTREEIYVPGIWGPYYNAMIPNMWLLAGGQSVSGKLIDHIIDTHPASSSIKSNCKLHPTQYLNHLLNEIANQKELNSLDELTKHIHIWPDFHGNRSPLGDPSLRGMIHGLTLATDEQDLAVLYLATIQALAYSTRFIIDTMRSAGHDTIRVIVMCGGLSKNPLFVKTHADAIGLQVLVPEESESVILGAAMLGATAAGFYENLEQAMTSMAGPARLQVPDSRTQRYHQKKYQVFLEMLNHQDHCRTIMKDAT